MGHQFVNRDLGAAGVSCRHLIYDSLAGVREAMDILPSLTPNWVVFIPGLSASMAQPMSREILLVMRSVVVILQGNVVVTAR